MATSVHECTFALEIRDQGRYLTGWYLCTQCGAHKSVQVSKQVSELLRWQDQLKKTMAQHELHLKKWRNDIRPMSFDKKIIADSLASLDKTRTLFGRSLKQMETSAEVLAKATVYSVDLHYPFQPHSTSNGQAECSATTVLPGQ